MNVFPSNPCDISAWTENGEQMSKQNEKRRNRGDEERKVNPREQVELLKKSVSSSYTSYSRSPRVLYLN